MGKTNAVRILEQQKIPFTLVDYEVDESDLSAVAVASKMGLPIDQIFKTLVLRSSSHEIFVCIIPGACELDLKKAAAAAGFKKADLIPVKEILPLTGYIRGGCSPIGMKKAYPSYLDETGMLYDDIYVSAGVRGTQVNIKPEDLTGLTGCVVCDLV